MRVYAAALAALLAGCATVNPVPVPRNDFTTPGLRFYEMRPFVLVQKPFPIATQTIFVDAQISADGRNAKLLATLPPGFADSIFTTGKLGSLPTKDIRVATKHADDRPAGQDDTTQVPSNGSDSPPANATSNNESMDNSAAPPHNPPGSGSINYQVDLAGTPMFPVNDFFSIVYLPDYDRQYVVDVSSNFGFKRSDIKVSPGGGLLGYNSEVDNSAIIGPVLKVWSTLMSDAGAVAEVALNPHGYALGKIEGQSGVTSLEVSNKVAPGGTVTLRLTKISYAIPGPYPILKPAETAVLPLDKAISLYDVPYKSFDVTVAEALFDAPSVVLAATSAGPKPQVNKKPEAPDMTADCAKKQMLATANVTKEYLTKLLGEIKKDLQVTKVTVKADGSCAAAVELSAQIGDAIDAPAFLDDDKAVSKNFADSGYKNTQLTFVK